MKNNQLKYSRNYRNTQLAYDGNLEISSHLYLDSNADITDLTKLSLEELSRLKDESMSAEKAMFDAMEQYLTAWELQAEKTMLINKAIEFVTYPVAKHTNNQWIEQNGWFTISNLVYKMNYHINTREKYDKELGKLIPYQYEVSWNIYLNTPIRNICVKIAGRDNRPYKDKESAEKYINGRIKTYQYLFTEISPTISQEYAEYFKVNGQLLPGYTVETKDGGNL